MNRHWNGAQDRVRTGSGGTHGTRTATLPAMSVQDRFELILALEQLRDESGGSIVRTAERMIESLQGPGPTDAGRGPTT